MNSKLLNPDYSYLNISYISAEELKKKGISVLFLDADNTLRKHHCSQPEDFTLNFIDNMKSNGIELFLTSNAKKSNVKDFASTVGLQYLYLCKKPLPFKLSDFMRSNGFLKSNVAIVGDQLFTDILCSKLLGVTGILVKPIQTEDGWNFKIRRKIESIFLKGVNYVK